MARTHSKNNYKVSPESEIMAKGHLDPLFLNQTNPDPDNQLCILCNMARTHSKNNYKVSPRVRNHGQRAPWPTEATASGRSCWKCNTHSNQGRGKYKWNTPQDIWPNWKYIFWPYWGIYSAIRHMEQLHTGGLPLWLKQHPNHTTQKNNRTLNTE